ncbi:kinase-like domain-containing protein [Schizophyllum commune]
MAPLDLDLTTPDGVLQYLSNTPFASRSATSMSGGTANFAYRVHLNAPYEGRSTLVLKFGRSFLEIEGQRVPFDIARQRFEAEALKAVRSWVPTDSLVTVSAVHLFDDENHVLIMDDCGESSVTLKALIREKNISTLVAECIGRALGEFLALVHSRGAKQSQEFLGLFASNEQARSISAWATYGRARETLDGSAGIAVLADPPLDVEKEKLDKVGAIASEVIERLKHTEDKFVMGDFWPGNVLVTLDGEEIMSIQVVDWELAKTGIPELDVGQFLAEMYLICRFDLEARRVASATARAFLGAYRGLHAVDPRTATIHCGVHLIAWTPRVSWGGKETTKQVVMEGVDMMCREDGDVLEYFVKAL